MARIPAYRKMYAHLKNEIKTGNYQPGSFLPTEAEMEKEFGVSRTTVRKAISMLTQEGYLSVRQGRGTEVQDVSTSQRLNTITSFTETLTQKGYKVTTQGFSLGQIPAPGFIRDAFSLKQGELVHHLQRVQCADGTPICIIENYISMSLVPELVFQDSDHISLYSYLEHHYGIMLKDALENISAVPASFTEAQILRVPTGTPLLHSTRITYTEQGPLEYSIINVIAERYEYQVYLSGRPL